MSWKKANQRKCLRFCVYFIPDLYPAVAPQPDFFGYFFGKLLVGRRVSAFRRVRGSEGSEATLLALKLRPRGQCMKM